MKLFLGSVFVMTLLACASAILPGGSGGFIGTPYEGLDLCDFNVANQVCCLAGTFNVWFVIPPGPPLGRVCNEVYVTGSGARDVVHVKFAANIEVHFNGAVWETTPPFVIHADLRGGRNEFIMPPEFPFQCKVTSGDGKDYISTGSENDVIHSGGGNDTVFAQGGQDNITSSAGFSNLFGGDGHDLITSLGGVRDILVGGKGEDTLKGSWGRDFLVGDDVYIPPYTGYNPRPVKQEVKEFRYYIDTLPNWPPSATDLNHLLLNLVCNDLEPDRLENTEKWNNEYAVDTFIRGNCTANPGLNCAADGFDLVIVQPNVPDAMIKELSETPDCYGPGK